MKIEINTATEELRASHLKTMLTEFIREKTAPVLEHQGDDALQDTYSLCVWKKYCASLWMVGCRLGMFEEQEVARHADISPAVLRDWQQQPSFNALIAEHYREFLEVVIAVLT